MSLINRGRVMADYLTNIGRRDSYKAKFEALVKAIDEAPAVEKQEKPLQQWKVVAIPNCFDTMGNPDQQVCCPACDFIWNSVYSALTYFKHCPNCGEPLAQPVDIPKE